MPKSSTGPTVEMVRGVSIFSRLPDKQLKSIASICNEISFGAGEVIVKEGDRGVGFYLIGKGEVEVRRKGKRISGLGKGNFFGEMSLLDAQPRAADVVALTPTVCFGVTDRAFASLVGSDPEIALNLMKELVRRLRGTTSALTE